MRWIAELEERLASGEKVSEFDAADSLIRYCAKSKDFFSVRAQNSLSVVQKIMPDYYWRVAVL